MARAIWSGSLLFGLVSIPVRMYSAIDEKDVHFHLLHRKDDSRIGYEKVCKKEDKVVPDDEIGTAYEVSKGKYVYLEDEDFEAAEPKGYRTFDLSDFVPLDGDRPDLLRPHLLPRTGGGRREGLRGPHARDGEGRACRDRNVRDAKQAASRLPAGQRRCAAAVAALLRRRDPTVNGTRAERG